MKANELRIGNLVYLKSKDAIYEISSGHDIEEIDDAPINFDAKPIPLTEEWLLKFGFEFYKKQVSLNVGGELFNYAVKNEIIIWTDLKTGWTLDGRINRKTHWLNSVHQLQNLYFALTGEELTFKSE
jgi:hypothetical protein